MTTNKPTPPFPDGPLPDWAQDTPRPTPPPSVNRRAFIRSEWDEVEANAAREGMVRLRKAVAQLHFAGCTGREIERMFWAAMRDRNEE
jgi:hypothetical protein